MKKFFAFTLAAVLSVTALFSLTACGDKQKWNGVGADFKTLDANAVAVGGFIAETQDYLYYINGMPTFTDDNTLGVPVKGALMAAKKSDLTKTEVVVPKLFAGTDYNAGVYIYGEYVYYGTPSLDKDSSGNIANSEMAFMRTKLDGTASETFFTVSSLSTQYRILAKDGNVSIVYYDAEDTAIKSFDTVTKTQTTIAVTDVTADVSLATYNFVEGPAVKDGVSVVYTVTVYDEKYYEEKAEASDYSRATKPYNLMYVLKAGETAGTLVGDGATTGMTYAVTLVDGANVYYTETDEDGDVKNYVANAKDLGVATATTEIDNANYVASANLILAQDEVYSLAEGKIYLSKLVNGQNETDNLTKKVVAISATASTLVAKQGDYIYYYNASNNLARIKLLDQDAVEERVSEDIVSTSWFAPTFITLGQDTFVFYLDNSTVGSSYIKYVKLNAKATGEDTNDDDENDLFYLEGHKFLGKVLDADLASMFESKVGAIATNDVVNGVLSFEEVEKDGKKVLTVKSVEDIRAEYEALSSEVKELISDDSLETIKNYEKAIEIANLYKTLDGVKNYEVLGETAQQAVKTAYLAIKDAITTFKQLDGYATIRDLIGNDLNRNYQKAVEIFED